MIAHTLDGSILFYHPETGRYSVYVFIPHSELMADVVVQNNGKFYFSKWYEYDPGLFRNAVGKVWKVTGTGLEPVT